MSAGPSRSTLLGLLAALVALVVATPDPGQALTDLQSAGTATDPTGPLVGVLALAAWSLGLWLAMTVLLVLAAQVPGVLGRAAARGARAVAPATVRRAVEVALGVSIALGTMGAVPASAATGPAPDLDWPDVAATTAPTPAAVARPVPPSPVPPGPAAGRPTTTAPVKPAAVPDPVVVQPGDTLWDLAAARPRQTGTASPSDRQIASSWPLWWSTNRQVIGDDPDLIRPGTVLRPPASP